MFKWIKVVNALNFKIRLLKIDPTRNTINTNQSCY